MKRTMKSSTKKIKIQSTTKGLSAQAGMIPVVHFLKKHQLYKKLNQLLGLERACNAKWQLSDAVYLTTTATIAGARALSSVKTIWADSVLREIDGWESIPDDTTLSRVFKQCTNSEIEALQGLNHSQRHKIWNQLFLHNKASLKRRKSHWVDIDSTVKTVYGKQEGAEKGFNTHKKGAYSYHPLLAFSAHTKEIIQGCLRNGSIYSSTGSVEFIQQLQKSFGNLRMILRGDSAFFDNKLINTLEKRGDGYLFKVKLRNLNTLLEKQTWRCVRNQAGWEQCQFEYACGSWEKSRQFVAVRKELPPKESAQLSFCDSTEYDYFCYVSSESMSPWKMHKTYGQRATCETWIEESKNQMALAHIKTNSFNANAVIFQCAVLAYNFIRWMAALSMNKKLRSWEPQTVRCFLIRVAGKLVHGSRQLLLNTPDKLLHQKQWDDWLKFSNI
jgi:hypothetical protein